MASEPAESLSDRLLLLPFSAMIGAIYGVLLWVFAFFITEQSHPNLIALSAAIFAFLGFIYGNFAFDAILALVYFVWGLFIGLTEAGYPEREEKPKGHWHSVLLVGIATGVILLVASYVL